MSKLVENLRHPIITGTSAERSAKTVLTVFFAAAYIMLLSASGLREKNAAYYAAYLSAGIDVIAIVILRRGIQWPMWRCIPFFQYSICCAIHMAVVWGQARAFSMSHFYDLFRIVLLFLAVWGLCSSLRQNGTRAQFEHLSHFHLPMLPFTFLDFAMSVLDMIESPTEFHFAIEFLARFSFYIACMLLAIPDRVLLINVKRVFRVGLMLATVAVLGAGGFLALSLLSGEHFPLAFLLFGGVFLSIDVVAIGSMIKNNSLNPMSWIRCIKNDCMRRTAAEEARRRAFLLDEALERHDYAREYAERLWNMTFYRADIISVQKRLNDIREERNDLYGCTGDLFSVRLKTIEAEAEDLLGKLSFLYKFDTGFDSCPFELLIGDDET